MKIKLYVTGFLLILAGLCAIIFYYYTGRGRTNIAFAASAMETPIGYLRAQNLDYINPSEFKNLLLPLRFKVNSFGSGSYGADVCIFTEGEFSLLTRSNALGKDRFVAYRKRGSEIVPLNVNDAESLLMKTPYYRFWLTREE